MQPISALTGQTFIFGQNEKSNSGLPDELIRGILSYLDIKSLASATKSCKKLNYLGQDAQLWEYLCIRDFFNKKSLNKIENWKNYYQTCLGLDYLQIPFPGKGGVFHLDPNKNWEVHYSITSVLRELRFVSGTKDSIFSEFALFGYENGEVALWLSSNKHDPLRVYLQSVDLSKKLANSLLAPTTEEIKRFMYISNPDSVKKIFRIFSQFNEIPGENLCLMRKIIWSENWHNITPLSVDDVQKINSERIAHEKAHKPRWLGWLINKNSWS